MSKEINLEDAKKDLKKLIAEIGELTEEEIKEDANLVDLGIDSMAALEIVANLEKKYKVTIPEEKIPTIRTLQNVYQILEEHFEK